MIATSIVSNRRVVLGLLILSLGTSLASAQASEAEDETYLNTIKPLFSAKCYACHGPLNQEADLRVDTRTGMLEGGDSGPAIDLTNADASLILERITAEDDLRMPPEGEGAPLHADDIKMIRRWLSQGAPAPDEQPAPSPRDHWAFQPIVKPQLASESSKTEPAHPIDRLIRDKLTEQGLQPSPAALRKTLIRRLYLDVIGLPPNLRQLQDSRPIEEIIDDLLASPHHGERWGRHWMDVWRYSDWYGLGAQLRNSQKHLWHWRDWIVESLNQDKGYDRMVVEMLAGDELAPQDRQAVAATGFLARNYYLFNRDTWLESTVEHTGKAFLGLTFNCARCHDHKYDPISQLEYYKLRSVFEPHQIRLDPVSTTLDFEQGGLPRAFDDHLDAPTYVYVRGDSKQPDTSLAVEPGVPSILGGSPLEIKPIELPPSAYFPSLQSEYLEAFLAENTRSIAEAQAQLDEAIEQHQAFIAKQNESDVEPPNDEKAPQTTSFLFRDDFNAQDETHWEWIGNSWDIADGKLRRTTSTRAAEVVRFKPAMPKDFDVTLEFVTTGGELYKSVTVRFDVSDDQQFDNFVYTSAHAPEPKVQVAYTREGSNHYPADGKRPRPIRIGEVQRLRIACRNRLVNVWHDDELVLSYELPSRQPNGYLSLSGFDATVEFDWIEIKALDSSTELKPAANQPLADPASPEQRVAIAKAQLAALRSRRASVQAVILADRYQQTSATEQVIRSSGLDATLLQAQANIDQAMLDELNATDDAQAQKARQAKQAAIQRRESGEEGDINYDSIRASQKALETPEHNFASYPASYSSKSSGRRLALARWITAPENPLAARVAVNHIWMRHIGEPLVETVFDFGLRAPAPEQLDLLDYLAAELIESGWSMKHIHRLILTSQTYQQVTEVASEQHEAQRVDPTNRFLWRMNARRMESQLVRDSVLGLAGTLDATLGGPSLDVGPGSRRRSLYFKHSRDEQDKLLSMFDDADLLQCYRRSESVVPQQALALANSGLIYEHAKLISEQAGKSAVATSADPAEFVRVVFEWLLARPPSQQEIDICSNYMKQLEEHYRTTTDRDEASVEARVRHQLVHSLLNHNDFITIR